MTPTEGVEQLGLSARSGAPRSTKSGTAASGSRAAHFFRLSVSFAILVLVALLSGAALDRWATKNGIYSRLDNRAFAFKQNLVRWGGGSARDGLADGGWRAKASHLLRLEYLPIRIPNSDGTGGGLQGLHDGRVFYATAYGEFGVIGTDGHVQTLPYTVDMNLEALKKHPVFKAPNFHYNWIRVTDIDVRRLGSHRDELLVGHHFFSAEGQCIEMRLSRGVIDTEAPGIPLVEPFKTVLRTSPCITFAGAERENAIDAYASGGRLVRLPDGKVLFSTGDHNWAGIEGYPALSADDGSTLGKILQVDLATGSAKIFAKGVRNPQGLTLDSRGRLWETEHGPRGGDELNLIVAGGDYGWPDSTYGTDYGPHPWPRNPVQGRHAKGIAPQFSWAPSIGVSNLIEVTSDQFGLWRGDLLVSSLANQSLRRLRLEGDRIVYDEMIPFPGFRIRDITQLPDGRIAAITDQGYVLLIRNADHGSPMPFLDASKQKPRTEDLPPQDRARARAGAYSAEARLAALTAPSDGEPAVMRGREVFGTMCSTCHASRPGADSGAPNLSNVIGRRVGSTAFQYSDALADRSERWTPSDVVEFAAGPAAFYPGSAMLPINLSAEQRRDLEAYLRSGPMR